MVLGSLSAVLKVTDLLATIKAEINLASRASHEIDTIFETGIKARTLGTVGSVGYVCR